MKLAIPVIALLLVYGCDVSPEADQNVAANLVLTALEVGQESRYLGFVGENYRDADKTEFSYTGDTLIVEVVEQTSEGFVVEEYLSDGSVSDTLAQKTKIVYLLNVENDQLTATSRTGRGSASALYRFNLDLSDGAGDEVQLAGWKTTLSYCECNKEGFLTGQQVLGKTYDRLNMIQENLGMAVDGPGFTYIYSGDDGMVRQYTVSWWTNTGEGWDLLPR